MVAAGWQLGQRTDAARRNTRTADASSFLERAFRWAHNSPSAGSSLVACASLFWYKSLPPTWSLLDIWVCALAALSGWLCVRALAAKCVRALAVLCARALSVLCVRALAVLCVRALAVLCVCELAVLCVCALVALFVCTVCALAGLLALPVWNVLLARSSCARSVARLCRMGGRDDETGKWSSLSKGNALDSPRCWCAT